METPLEDGLYLAVSHYVHGLLCLYVFGWIDSLCVYTAHPRATIGRGCVCEFSYFLTRDASRSIEKITLTGSIIGKIAWIFLAVSALFGSIFMFASFWIYHYIDFKNEFEDRFDVEMDD